MDKNVSRFIGEDVEDFLKVHPKATFKVLTTNGWCDLSKVDGVWVFDITDNPYMDGKLKHNHIVEANTNE